MVSNSELFVERSVNVVVQVSGKFVKTLKVSNEIDNSQLKSLALGIAKNKIGNNVVKDVYIVLKKVENIVIVKSN